MFDYAIILSTLFMAHSSQLTLFNISEHGQLIVQISISYDGYSVVMLFTELFLIDFVSIVFDLSTKYYKISNRL